MPPSKLKLVDFKNLFEQVSLNTILLLKNKDIFLERHLPPAYPPVIGSEEGLDMVFTTLIENACHNSPIGGKIILEGKAIGGFFEIRITDFGSDLDESSLPYLFQSVIFVDAGHFHSNHLEGAESGLYVAKTIIQEHNGFISGALNPKGGSIFIVKLPMASDIDLKTHSAQKTDSGSKKSAGHLLDSDADKEDNGDDNRGDNEEDKESAEDQNEALRINQGAYQKLFSKFNSNTKGDFK
jgi:hypothetical protein